VGGSPGGTIADTSDDAWRSAFESVFLGAVRLARTLATSLAGQCDEGSLTGTGGSIAFVLAASVRAPLPGLAISNGLFPGLAGVVKTLADEHGPSGIRINGLGARPGRHRPGPPARRPPRRPRRSTHPRLPGHPAAPLRRTRGVRAGRRLRALPRRVLHHRRDDPHRICWLFFFTPSPWLKLGIFITLIYSIYANLATDYGAMSAAEAAFGEPQPPPIPLEPPPLAPL
jgi:NAD(P)-dependent dehydrogenase (short-subunit alcohol dehydrogenase family)